MDGQLLVVGVDPGITAAYAALNLDGEIVRLKSSKNLNLGVMLKELSDAGKVVVVGTDVKYSPKFVEKMCSRLNARLVAPREDMKVGLKSRLTMEYKCRDAHQRDALAAALVAYHEVRPLVMKVNEFLKREGKEHLSHSVMLLALNGVSLRRSLELLEQKSVERLKRKRERRKVKPSTTLFEVNARLSRENGMLQGEVAGLKLRLERMSENLSRLVEEKAGKALRIKQVRIDEEKRKVVEYGKKVMFLREEVADLKRVLLSVNNKVVAKRLRNLGASEVEGNVGGDDKVIFVDDPSVFSERALEVLRGRVETIIYRGKVPRVVAEKPFHFVGMGEVHVEVRENFVVVDANELKKEKEKSDVLYKVVKEYQEERGALV